LTRLDTDLTRVDAHLVILWLEKCCKHSIRPSKMDNKRMSAALFKKGLMFTQPGITGQH
jgi:hypothetical protein